MTYFVRQGGRRSRLNAAYSYVRCDHPKDRLQANVGGTGVVEKQKTNASHVYRALHGHTATVQCAAVNGHRYEQTLVNWVLSRCRNVPFPKGVAVLNTCTTECGYSDWRPVVTTGPCACGTCESTSVCTYYMDTPIAYAVCRGCATAVSCPVLQTALCACGE